MGLCTYLSTSLSVELPIYALVYPSISLRQDHVDDVQHQTQLDSLEKEWNANNAGPKRNIHLSVRPLSIFKDEDVSYLWQPASVRTSDQSQASWSSAFEEGQRWIRKYNADAQFVFSHVQQHWHGKNDVHGLRQSHVLQR